jgi:membrane-bound ClpP family serine protease
VTTGEMIERGERVCVVEVKGNRVVVTRAKA